MDFSLPQDHENQTSPTLKEFEAAFGGQNTPNFANAFDINSEASKIQQVIASVNNVQIFDDERDEIYRQWNLLQASWGTGKGYYSNYYPPIEYDHLNPFYRFKDIGYNLLPEIEEIVSIVFNKNIKMIIAMQDILENGIGSLLGHNPNSITEIIQIMELSNNQTEIKLIVVEREENGTFKNVPSSEIESILNQPGQMQQLSTIGVISVKRFVPPHEEALRNCMKYPPPGIDPQLWKEAIENNPDPDKIIPVPIYGFANLRNRMLQFERHTGLTQAFLDKCHTAIVDLKSKYTTTATQLSELKSKCLELQHRSVQILVDQEIMRKAGTVPEPEEEYLDGKFERILLELEKLANESDNLLSNSGRCKQDDSDCLLDTELEEEITDLLKYEEYAMAELSKIIEADAKALIIIKKGFEHSFPFRL